MDLPKFHNVGPESVVDKHNDPACIVGMACRLPGGVDSPSKLWDTFMNKHCHSGPVPATRFDASGWCHPDRNRAGVMDVPGGYFLDEDVRQYDAGFFGGLGGAHNLEAAGLDPQQRKLLEVVYECFEHAGATLGGVAGSNTGVYVGNFTVDHATMQLRDPDAIGRYTAMGVGTSLLANRISYVFDLQGPSQVLDTACSSTLYCLHNAVQALAGEQCLGTAKGGFLSPSAICHTFDAGADGYARGEAVNAIYIKRLSDAQRDGDKVWAVIRGTAVNANGRTSGIAQPNADRQEAVIRKAYSAAKLDVLDTDYVECHGTGTPIGDPIEVAAIARCFTEQRRDTRLFIGASKPNFGHSEAASGLTAIIKAAMALDMGKIPPTRGIVTLNPKLQLDSRNMSVVQEAVNWPRALRRVSINSFGYGGANSHAILESVNSFLQQVAGREQSLEDEEQQQQEEATSQALVARVTQVTEVMAQIAGTGSHSQPLDLRRRLRDIAYTLGQRRSQMDFRKALLLRVKDLPGGQPEVCLLENEDGGEGTNSSNPLPVGLIFTGQGAQWAGMGKQLLKTCPTFSKTIRDLDGVLQGLPDGQAPGWTIEQTLVDPAESSQIGHVTRSQPVCTALQIALVDMLESWGVAPAAVVGHSSGEIAAAYAAGLLSARQAILVAYFRGVAVGTLRGEGAMMAAGLGPEAASQLIQDNGLGDEVCVACVNAPESTTLSGSATGIELLLARLQGQGKFARMLQTGGRAYHSAMMKQVGALYERLLAPHLGDGPEVSGVASSTNGGTGWRAQMFSSVGFDGDHINAAADSATVNSTEY
ncbi:hypothetical protein DHEL01_v206959 [Diaporthe helianthi]|uniref:Polyketide synthase 21 n=1 Tax=Diaporthe helianthi TaxID=158607 RepID=A0A1C1XG53_DIAHE|nr:polyketide synthase 21 [Diaporthe helianthi]POS74652.1 hypothetical protein DHEL01_v206959 [Diaporthe helianthi]